MTVGPVVVLFFAGGALLAMWIIARFPFFAPRTLGSAILALGLGLLLGLVVLTPVLRAVLSIAEGRVGLSLALFLVALPIFTYFSLSILWMLRALMSLMGLRS